MQSRRPARGAGVRWGCGSEETARVKFQSFAVGSGATAESSEGVGPRSPGSGPCDDFTPGSMADDLDSDVAHL